MYGLPSNRRSLVLRSLICLFLLIFGPSKACYALELRKVDDGTMSQSGFAIPDDAVSVFVYAGEPGGIKVNEKTIAVNYGRCGIVFNRKNGQIKERYDISDNWPETRPEEFPKNVSSRTTGYFIGPGMFEKRRTITPREQAQPEFEETCSIVFKGTTWQACQPARFRITIQSEGYDDRTGPYSTWSGVLERLNNESFIKANTAGQEPKRYTMSDGLASNIITKMVESQGFLWASCVDIYEPEQESWGPGGLSRFDPKTNKWEHIKTIEGHPVRWITLMETIDDDLWIGFREGDGVDGDKIYYGMGVSAKIYRPKVSAIILARFSKGKWSVFPKPLSFIEGMSDVNDSLTQMPLKLAILNEKAVLFCGYRSREHSYNYEYKLDGCVSSLNLKSGQWKTFDLYKDFDADKLIDMHNENNEILIKSNRGVHRWDAESQSWKFLDPQTELKNPSLSTAALRDNELWIGYTNQSFGVLGQQGISVFNEETLEWSYINPEQIGTGCPVRRMAIKSNGDVWIFCEWFPSDAVAAQEYPYYLREAKYFMKSGFGYFKNGKWKYPIEILELKDFEIFQRNVHDLVAIDDKIYIASREGLYIGPEKWQKIVDGDILRIDPSSDGKTLKIIRQGPREDPNASTFQKGNYDLTTGEVSFVSVPFEEVRRMQWEPQSYLWERNSQEPERWRQDWVLLPELGERKWIIGNLNSNDYHGVIETPYAFWIASEGELVRLDRKAIENIIEKKN